jgi:hypothetical protein
MTTTQQNAIATPRTGLEIYNSTLGNPQYYNGTGWIPSYNFNTSLTINVDATYGTDTRTGLSKYSFSQPFKTIQAAITAFANGDNIVVRKGTYAESVTITNANASVNMIYQNGVIHNAVGTASAITVGNNYTYLNLYMNGNSIIANTGDTLRRDSSAAIFCYIGGNSGLVIVGIGNTVGNGGFTSIGTNYRERPRITSVNSYAVSGGTASAASPTFMTGMVLYSRFSAAASRLFGTIENCVFKSDSSFGIVNRTEGLYPISNCTFNTHLTCLPSNNAASCILVNCDLQSRIGGGVWGVNWGTTGISINNCRFKTFDKCVYMSPNAPTVSKCLITNSHFSVTNTSTAFSVEVTNSNVGSIGVLKNNIYNKAISIPATYNDYNSTLITDPTALLPILTNF